MSFRHWIFERKEFVSEKNGIIVCQRTLGRWHVSVNGTGQTSAYTTNMWRRALRHIPKKTPIRTVLVLGLGAGGDIEPISKRFPDCRITSIEYDPIMIELADKLHLFTSEHHPTIICGDARAVLPTLTQKFDLILLDIFCGKDPSPLIEDAHFIAEIQHVLAPNGYLMANVYRKYEYLKTIGDTLSCYETWQYKLNHLGLFRPHGLGRAGEPLPRAYVEPRAHEPYLRSNFYHPSFQSEIIVKESFIGARWHHGFAWFEEYVTDEEPIPDSFPYSRMILWHPITRTDIPKGWRRLLLHASVKKTGFVEITDPKQYSNNWSDHAKRHRKKFLEQESSIYCIETGTLLEYERAYRATKKYRHLENLFIHTLMRRTAVHGTDVNIWLARVRATGEIIAGLATVDLPAISQSVHTAAFITHAGEQTSIGTGLIDHWFRHCIARGIRVLNFGTFYTKGNSRSWKGFSRFKAQFGIRYVRFPTPLFRWMRKNK